MDGKKGALIGLFVVLFSLFGVEVASAATTIPPLTVTDATTYLQDNASTNMQAIAEVLFGLAGLAVAIRWVKATFFS